MNDIAKAVQEMALREEAIRTILVEEFEIVDIVNSDYQAVAYLGVDCAVRLMNVLNSARKPSNGGTYKAIMDLTIGLSGNSFWRQNGSLLMPLLIASLQAQSDYALLRHEQLANPNSTVFSKLEAESELVGLEVFTAIGNLISGYDKMSGKSLQLKKRLLPYLSVTG